MDERREAAEDLCAQLVAAGHRALFAGGCVRDLLLGQHPKDYDVATDARPEQVAALFDQTIPVGAAFGVTLVVPSTGPIEVATFRKDGPYSDGRHPDSIAFCDEREDALRRDFTINAMFQDPATGETLDYVGGQEDLKRGIIRTVGDPHQRFEEDHLRLLRAVRFASRLNFAIATETMEAIKDRASSIHETSAERIRDELLKMLTEGNARGAFALLDETGLLSEVLPEVDQMKGIDQPPAFHPEGDVFAHTMLLLENLDALDSRSPTLALGALLHDVGKPSTQTFEDRIRFSRHDQVGAKITKAICKRLRMSSDDSDRVTWLVAQHMRPAGAQEMRETKRKRMVREEGFDELLALCFLDAQASHGDTAPFQWLRDYAANLEPEELRPPRILSGEDLIAMGYGPGPLFAEILTAIEDAQLEGKLAAAEEARDFVRRHWPLA
jgi:poly(A) polymerase